jgi:hypothetical protein
VFERVVVGSDRYFVKRFGFASDWVMRVSGDRVGRQYLVWQAGIMDRSPGCIDHTVVAMGVDGAGEEAVLTIVMREVGEYLVPPGGRRAAIWPARRVHRAHGRPAQRVLGVGRPDRADHDGAAGAVFRPGGHRR